MMVRGPTMPSTPVAVGEDADDENGDDTGSSDDVPEADASPPSKHRKVEEQLEPPCGSSSAFGTVILLVMFSRLGRWIGHVKKTIVFNMFNYCFLR
jgi:hypothetical protein